MRGTLVWPFMTLLKQMVNGFTYSRPNLFDVRGADPAPLIDHQAITSNNLYRLVES